MTWRRIFLALILIVSQNSLVYMNITPEKPPGQDKSPGDGPNIRCTLAADQTRWQADHTPAVSVEIDIRRSPKTSVMPALHLTALPKKGGIYQDEYWAPFSVANGTATTEWQKLAVGADKKPFSVRLVPSELQWAATKSSVWPSDPMAKVVPPGEYSLQVKIEVNKDATFTSNEVRVIIIK
jgi:hypothetical protein